MRYIAYENIEKYSPVFSFLCEDKNTSYVYISRTFKHIDGGTPYCIGICTKTVKKNEIACIITSGSGYTSVRYIGQISKKTETSPIYLTDTFNGNSVFGVASTLGENIVPYTTNNNSFLIKIGDVLPKITCKKCKKCNKCDKSANTIRLVKVFLGIDNQNRDLFNIHTLDQIPKINIQGLDFSFYTIGQALQKT